MKKKLKKETRFSRFLNKYIYIALAFICSSVLMTIVYYCFDVIPFGNKTILRMDLFHQYGPLFGELYDRITSLKSFLYSTTSGGGSSFLGNYFNYMSSPISFIILIFGRTNIPEAIGAMVFIKNALSSSAMAYYLKKTFNKNDFSISAFGIMYSFCGFFIAYYWNIMWIDAMYLLPLVALGIQKIINERKAKLYTVSLAITFFANYYMAYMVCIFSVFLFLVYYFSNYSIKSFIKEPSTYVDKKGVTQYSAFDCIRYSRFLRTGAVFGVCSVLAAALVAFALIPTYIILKSCSATSGVMPEELTSYDIVFNFLANHLASVTPTIRSSGDMVMPNVYSGMLTLVLMPLYFFCKKINIKDKIATTLFLALFFFIFNFNVPNYIIHAFHFPNDLPFRFSFVYSFFIIVTAYKVLLNIKSFTGKEILASAFGIVAFIILVEAWGQDNVTENSVLISIVFAVIYSAVLWLMKNPKYYQPTVSLLLMCCVFAEAAIANTDNFEITQEKPNFVNGYNEFRELKNILDEKEHGDNYRMELTNLNTLMDNCWFGYNGISMFSSMAYERFANVQDDLGIKSNYINSYVYNPNTPVYNAMMSLRYIVDNNDLSMNNQYYKYIDSVDKFKAYENKYCLPLAYCVNSSVKDWRASLDTDPFVSQSKYWEYATGVSDVFMPVEISDYALFGLNEEDCSIEGTNFTYSKNDSSEGGESIQANYVIPESGNIYTYVDSTSVENATVSYEGFSTTQDLSEPYILDLGYHEANDVITVDLPVKDDFYSGNIECYVYSVNDSAFKEGFNILKNGGMNIEEYSDTSVKGSVKAEKACLLYTSIPYDKGWSVTVDGKQADIKPLSNDALLAVKLTKGNHKIEFHYRARGLFEGLCISGGALLFVIIYLIIKKIIIKRNDRKKAVYISAGKNENSQPEITGIDALFEQDLGPDATEEDSEALLEQETEIPEE